MTTPQLMPVIPNPESDQVLFQMLDLILNHPSCINIPSFGFEIPPQEMIYFLNNEWKESWIKGEEALRRVHPHLQPSKYFDLPDGDESIKRVLVLVDSIKNKDLYPFPQELRRKLSTYKIEILIFWKEFSLLHVVAYVSTNNRKLIVGYNPDDNAFLNERFYNEAGYLSHLSKPFINLFQQFKVMFNKIWPGKYTILPEISDRKERALILSELRKSSHNPNDFKKINEFFFSKD